MIPTMSPQAAATSPAANHRSHLRFSCTAEVEATTVDGRRHLLATLSEISRCGCYLDTPEAFEAGTKIQLRIRPDGLMCDLPARVIYVHKGWGMGVLFEGTTAAQRAALDEWLVQLCRRELTTVA
jgi:hypothetical protein